MDFIKRNLLLPLILLLAPLSLFAVDLNIATIDPFSSARPIGYRCC